MMRRRKLTMGFFSFFIFSILTFLYALSSRATPISGREQLATDLKDSVPVRVRLYESAPEIHLRGMDLRLFDRMPVQAARAPGSKTTTAKAPALDWMLRLKPARMTEWTVKCSGSNIDLKVKETGQTFRFHSALKARSLAGFLTVASKPYREEVRVFSRGSGCEVVNVVDLEKYLDGLVNSEFSAEWSQESIEAQVIAARTYALFQIQQARRSAGSTYDLDASVKDQVYDGFIKEDFRASRAVEKTRGLVLMAQNSTKHWQVLKAFYHSTCGGMTELPQNVWGKALTGFNHRVRCAFCGSSPRYEWETRYTSDQLKQALLQGAQRDGVPRTWPRDAYSTIRSGSLVAMSLNGESRDPNSRVDTIDLLWKRADRGGFQEHIRISAALFRSWVSPLKIRSTLFRVQPEIQKNSSLQFVFSGRGNGHGVGMCQWGAKVMGEKGYRYPQILAYYYPGTKLQRFW